MIDTKMPVESWNSARESRGFEPNLSDEQRNLRDTMSKMSLSEIKIMVSLMDDRVSKYSKNSEIYIRMIHSDLHQQGSPSMNLAYLFDCRVGSIIEKADGLWKLLSIRKEAYMFGKTFKWQKVGTSEIKNDYICGTGENNGV